MIVTYGGAGAATGDGQVLTYLSGFDDDVPSLSAFPKLVPFDRMTFSRSRRHEEVVSAILNSLILNGTIILIDKSKFDLGYTPATPADWTDPPPTTIWEAIDRLAAVAASPP